MEGEPGSEGVLGRPGQRKPARLSPGPCYGRPLLPQLRPGMIMPAETLMPLNCSLEFLRRGWEGCPHSQEPPDAKAQSAVPHRGRDGAGTAAGESSSQWGHAGDRGPAPSPRELGHVGRGCLTFDDGFHVTLHGVNVVQGNQQLSRIQGRQG